MKKRVMLVVLGICLAMSSLFVLTACEKEAEAIRKTIESDLEKLKSGDIDALGDMSDTYSALEAEGIDSDRFFDVWLDGFDYAVGPITVKGKTATIELSITIKQMGPAVSDFVEEATALSEEGAFDDLTEDEANALFNELLLAAMEKQTPTTESVVLTYNREGASWVAAAGNDAKLNQAFLGEASNLGQI
ncbi:MAG: hypothetical protein LBG81_01425 [Coriobacteriaceae bacterium]|jgi:hypothetical protein|nr:hypothetical protein [Coriobacteriaceae bacterium]